MPRPTTRSVSTLPVVATAPPAEDVEDAPDDRSVHFPDPVIDDDAVDDGLGDPIEDESPWGPPNKDWDLLDKIESSPHPVDIEEAANLAENLPNVLLQPPSEDLATPRVIFTPKNTKWAARARSGGSSGGQTTQPKKKKGKGKAAAPTTPATGLSQPEPIMLRIPVRQPIPSLDSILERLAARPVSPAPTSGLPSSESLYMRTIFDEARKKVDSGAPDLLHRLRLRLLLAEVAPGLDFGVLLASLPVQSPMDLPDPNARTLLPGIQLVSSTSTVRSLPSALVQLDGLDLPLPVKVIGIVKANWNVHVPLTAITTKALTSASLASKEDSGQSLSIRDGVLSMASTRISARDEGSLSPQDWIHAFPRLIECIRRYLLSPARNAIADAWLKHYNTILQRPDFWDLFPLLLCYDIRLRVHFVDVNNQIDPSVWQEGVWRQIIDTYRTGSQGLLSGMGGIIPPAARGGFAPFALAPQGLFPMPGGPPPRAPALPLQRAAPRGPAPPPGPAPAQPPAPGGGEVDCSFFGASSVVPQVAENVPATPFGPILSPLSTATGKLLRVSRFVSGSMAAAAPNLLAAGSMHARAAESHTQLKSAITNGFLPIVTPFRWLKWEELLQEAGTLGDFSDVPKGIRCLFLDRDRMNTYKRISKTKSLSSHGQYLVRRIDPILGD
ncbi:hypothetical protein HYDPIDRAFT_34562 [Hydnomerulius pinastri MD-312]|uniref:Unplaced genomic scaffold scaffold_174, whole genome shotgun sequence n=1 Tax=Hydnomerulius pinastri MD-312 TaxID=994086 RepID=A0A0C9VKI9_9AGAM|nr:hypothetical protein HYDPIDRAFT_34562 [Hydnomerulius pinastri MD-312]